MSRVADGATTRKERILEMLNYIRSFMPHGVKVRQVWGNMELKFGLKWETTQGYIMNQIVNGLIYEHGQRLFTHTENLDRLLKLMEPETNPSMYDWWRDAPDTHTDTPDQDPTVEQLPPHNEEAEKKSERETERERARPRRRHVWDFHDLDDETKERLFKCARCGKGPFSRSEIRKGGHGDCHPQ